MNTPGSGPAKTFIFGPYTAGSVSPGKPQRLHPPIQSRVQKEQIVGCGDLLFAAAAAGLVMFIGRLIESTDK